MGSLAFVYHVRGLELATTMQIVGWGDSNVSRKL